MFCSKVAATIGLPPVWVDVSKEIAANVQHARSKMSELGKGHAKALMSWFADGKEDQRNIENLTSEITNLLKRSEKRNPSAFGNIFQTVPVSLNALVSSNRAALSIG
ncbi:hypothetical protein V6N13_009637 [Hibiscus sabdariffa]|uniref:Uncharacterized protein n=2 Tax=Hibiscus sabdariffa TaxID=183260 RepID=A0ABR2B4N8_9ROSI